MKKLLLLLLIPVATFSQTATLSHSYIDPDTNGFAVGDTITVKFEGILNSSTPDFVMFDFEYNNKLLEIIDTDIDPDSELPANTQSNSYHWVGYKFNSITSHAGVAVGVNQLDEQYQHGWQGSSNSYPTNADWNVQRLILQAAATLPSSVPWMYVKFKIKDKQGTSYSNYNNITKLNWAKFQDLSVSGDILDVQAGSQYVTLSTVSGTGAGNVTINLLSANSANIDDYTYSIKLVDSNGNPTGDAIASGNFDTNGQAIISGSTLTNELTYYITVDVAGNPSWLDGVLTVTDAYLIFQEAAGAGDGPGSSSNIFTYQIQYEAGELNNSGNVDFTDSYVALAHISGVESNSEWYTSVAHGAKNLYGDKDFYGVSSNDYYFGQKRTFLITESNESSKTINIGHGFKGDPDFSHSYTPTAEGSSNATSSTSQAQRSMSYNAMNNLIEANLDINSVLRNGKVVVEINLEEEGIVGNQFDILYDDSILTFEEVIFDTGNEMTNFSNHKASEAKIFVGSLDQSGNTAVKTGLPYKLVFTPNTELSNTVGLITFKYTEGVKADGSKVTFNIE